MNYSLFALFALIPLMFSHFFARLGEDFIISTGHGNFESVKVPVFLTLVLIVLIELSLKRGIKIHKNTISAGVGIITFSIVSFLISGDTPRDFLLGIGEKQHGILMFIGLAILCSILSGLKKKEKERLMIVALISGVIVASISLLEGIFGYNIFTNVPFLASGSWGDIRATATLGNPNYLAGYLLILIPITFSLKHIEKYWIIIILSLGILMTKSIIGISLCGIFFLFMTLSRYLSRRNTIQILCILGILSLVVLGLLSESEKGLSLISRFVLMGETLKLWISDPIRILFGSGPSALIEMYQGIRSDLINVYFPRSMTIDSSHNLIIDLIVKFGLVPICFFIYFIRKRWSSLENTGKYGIILGFLFFSLNVIVVSHWILFVLFLSLKKPPNGGES